MQKQTQQFTQELLQHINDIVESTPEISVSELSRSICERENWRSKNGSLKEMSCRKALNELEAKGLIKLPKKAEAYRFSKKNCNKVPPELPDLASGSYCLKDLGKIEVIPIVSRHRKESRIWNALMEHYHYLGAGPLCGAQIRYLIKSETLGWLGGFAFNSATLKLKSRDEWIGWDERARSENLERVVCNSRFLILPALKVKNLATHTISLCLNRLTIDWQERYHDKPVLVETFVDPTRFIGTCYQASNWHYLGNTAGRRSRFANGKCANHAKAIYAYPLCSDWRAILIAKSPSQLSFPKRQVEPTDWVENEFAGIEVYDDRLKERLLTVARDFAAQPGAAIPQACGGSEAKTKGAYRFFNNKQITMDVVLKPHIESTLERLQSHPVVLSVQDTTTLNYTTLKEAQGLGPINTSKDGGVGLVLHDTMAFSVSGTPLGLLDVQCWARDKDDVGKSQRRRTLPIEEKESFKWIKSFQATSTIQALCPTTQLVSVGDRESDLHELFYAAVSDPNGTKLLIRSERSRKRKTEEAKLWEEIPNRPIQGYQTLYVPKQGKRLARTAKLSVRYGQVTLVAPRSCSKLPNVESWAVYVKEEDCSPDIKDPLEWMLLTTVEVNNLEQAVERTSWYACRWGIETYHRTFKSGCRIEDRRLNSAPRLESCIAIDLVIAWRIFWLTKQSRDTPDASCEDYFNTDEYQVLSYYAETLKKKTKRDAALTLKDAVITIASLGGFIQRKDRIHPGTTTLWRGLQRLQDIVHGFQAGVQAAAAMQKQREGP